MKSKIITLAVAVMLAVLVGCGVKATHDTKDEFEIRKVEDNDNFVTYVILTDNETDVEYIVATSPDGMAICPRYNADGSLYVGR